MNRQRDAIQRALPIIAKAIGRRLNVDVKIGGKDACTDGTTVHLPELPFDDPDVETLAFGYLEHESAHLRYNTQFDSVRGLAGGLYNAIEDARVERALIQEYPGFERTLRNLVQWLVDHKEFSVPTAQDAKPAELVCRHLLYRLRTECLQQSSLAEHAAASELLVAEMFPKGVLTRIGSVVGRVPSLKSSEEARQLATEIVAFLQEELDPPPEESGGGAGTEQEGQSPPPLNATPMQIENLRNALEAETEECGGGVGELAKEALNEACRDSGRQSGPNGGVGLATEAPSPGLGNSREIVLDVAMATTALRTRLHGLLDSVRHSKRKHVRQGVRVDTRRLVPLLTRGDPKVFTTKTVSVDVNTAVTLLLDRSGSMEEGEKIDVARRAVLSLSAALQSIRGVAVCAAAFPGVQSEVELLMRFGQRVEQRASRFAAVHASGGTPLLSALLWAVDQHGDRAEKRHIVLCATDGLPHDIAACREAIERCWLGGIEVYGLGIGVKNIDSVFPVSQCVQRIDELAPAMFTMLQNALSRRAA